MRKTAAESRKKWRIIAAVFIALSVLEGFFLIYFHYFNIDFTEVHRERSEFEHESTVAWHSTRDEAKSGIAYAPSGIFGAEFSEHDLKKYTYVVSYGYELLDVSCSLSEMKNSNGLYFVPRMIFGSERNDTLYIYRLPKTELDYDMHSPDRNVFFK